MTPELLAVCVDIARNSSRSIDDVVAEVERLTRPSLDEQIEALREFAIGNAREQPRDLQVEPRRVDVRVTRPWTATRGGKPV